MTRRKPLTRTQRIAQERLYRYAWEESHDMLDLDRVRDRVPDAWHTLEQDLDVHEKKVKLTLYLDASVAKFYRGMGSGYQARINRLLGTWAQMKIAEVLRGDALLNAAAEEEHETPATPAPLALEHIPR
ncbi:hypothetical protein DL237_15060 [Pseudooceanicola sediminis]|uniref:BrnA antitoxin of type II toxin-antitoxin system n=1 Tax=Pseudooceanicola sediminis TaxID=2211117 RepID=A0A399J005_9RHOB|nr:BrnA antitoxin family protein [Pseudooceanicola sediminis]RII37987.1 hypothetical protein DL237_15060 [Pseudooceanicola sediminis]|tara:strand:- start:2003 stop:2389 length:387 start_codon:yes stop_codon:yes gene_type:complete